MRKIVLGVTGSIAAYKAAELVRLFVKAGDDVSVVMTEAATKFVTPLTFQTLSRNPVGINSFTDQITWKPEHISLAEKADLVVIAPATANTLAKIRYGLADNLLTETVLATRAPIVVAPAMNTGMYESAVFQETRQVLLDRGVKFVEPTVGELACGTTGRGRMAEPHTIFEACR